MTPTSSTRKQLRAKRRLLSLDDQKHCSDRIASAICKQMLFLRAKRIGVYIANTSDGEVDPWLITDIALKSEKQCFLPVLHPLGVNRLHFAHYHRDTQLIVNHYGIFEPDLKCVNIVPTWSLDVIFMPLVGFDRRGHRMGMGGGYYDRTLAFMNKPTNRAPVLIGLAHSCQEVDCLTHHSWDIPLKFIITEREMICVKPK
jgi:5-formyltetrahydrofolate cyclo-ligase